MNYVCKKTCQVRIGEKITLCNKGSVYQLDGPHPHFQNIDTERETYQVDFLKASEAELKGAKWKFSDAKKAISDAYDVELTKEEGATRMQVISQILDARYRAIDSIPFPTIK